MKTVLMIDPNPEAQAMMQRLTKITLLMAESFDTGWEIFRANLGFFDLVVIRAEINGQSALETIKSIREFMRTLPILVDSGDPKLSRALVGEGLASHFTNGVNLLAMVRVILRIKS